MPRHDRSCTRPRVLLLAAGLAVLGCALPGAAVAATTPVFTAPTPGTFTGATPLTVAWHESDPLTTSSFDVYVSQPDCNRDGTPINVPADGLVSDYTADVPLDAGDGLYCVSIVAHDVLGPDPDPASATYGLDTSAPSAPGQASAINAPDQFPELDWGPGAGDHGGSGVVSYSVYREGVLLQSGIPVGDGSHRQYTDTGAPAGTTHYGITVTDALGHESSQAPVNARYDGPSTSIDQHPPDPSRGADATFAFSASVSGSTFQCSLDADPDSACASPLTLHGIADGDHTFHVHAVDPNGTPGDEQTYRWTVNTAPAGLHLSGPSGLIDQTSATFTFTSDDPGSTFVCDLDGTTDAACTSPKQYAGLAQGPHHFAVTATDTGGGTASDSRDFVVDTVPPVVHLDSTPPLNSTSASATFQFSSESGVSFECRLDGGSFGNCDSPKTYNGLNDGGHTFDVRGTDPAGNTGDPTSYTWTVDASAPATTIDTGPSGLTNDPTPAFTFHSNDSSATFECSLGGGFAPCSSPDTLGPLGDGAYTFTVRARDAAGNVDPSPPSRSFTVDTTAPDTEITGGPNGPTNDATPAFSFDSPTDSGADFRCTVDGNPVPGCSSGQALPHLDDGNHVFAVSAVDRAGNVDPSPASRSFSVDTVAPIASIGDKPSDPTNSTTATFGFGANEGNETFTCQLDTQDAAACTSGITYSGLAAGRHTFRVRATDRAGNTGPFASYSWTVDTSAPRVTIRTGPSGKTSNHQPTFTFDSTASDASLTCWVDGDAPVACSGSFQTRVLGDGGHTFHVHAQTPAGNTGDDSRSFTVDTTPPDTTITGGPSGPTNDATPAFSFSSPDADAVDFQCTLNSHAVPGCASGQALSHLGDGNYVFQVSAIDDVGNVDDSPATRSFTVDTVAPTVAYDATPPNPSNSTSATFRFHASETATFACKLGATGTFAPCATGQTYNGLSEGPHSVFVQATDAAGNTGPAQRYDWVVDATAPTASITGGPSGLTNDDTPQFRFGADDPTAHFECSLDDAGFAACTSPDTLTVSGDGSHTFRVRAIDTAGNVGPPDAQTFVLDTTPPDTVIAGPQGPTNDATPQFTFSSPDPSVSTFRCVLGSGDLGACAATRQFGPLADGTYTVRAAAVDPAGNVDASPATRTFTVDTHPPTAVFQTHPSDPTNQTTGRFQFSSNESPVSFNCQLDAAAKSACPADGTFPGLVPGRHTLRLWAVDLTAPSLDIDGPAATNDTTPTFTFSSSPAGTFQCQVDSGARVACSSPYTVTAAVAQGVHRFHVYVTTLAGNTTDSDIGFTIDTTNPTVTVPTVPTLGQGVVHLTAGASDALSGIASISYYANGVFVGTSTDRAHSYDLAWATTGLPDGPYAITARSTDNAGNPSNLSGASPMRLDNSGPAIDFSSAPIVRGRVALSARVSDPSLVTYVEFRAARAGETPVAFRTVTGGDLSGAPVTATWLTGGTVEDGVWVLQVDARDSLGNDRASSTVTVVVDNTQPSTPGAPVASASPTRSAPMISWPANGGSDIAGYDVYRAGTRVATLLTGTSFADALATNGSQDGVYPYTVTAVDRAGNESSPSVPATVVLDTTPPGTPGSLTASADSSGNVALTWPATADPSAGGIASGIAGYVVRRAVGSAAPAGAGDGAQVCSVGAAVTTCSDSGRVLGQTVTYAVFASDAAGNVSSGAVASVTPQAQIPQSRDTTPTAKATTLKATIKASRATITWVNPKDADFDHVDVVINTKRIPRSAADGRRVYRGRSNKVSFLGTAGTRTHVAIFAFDHTGNVSPRANIDVRFAPALLQPLAGTVLNGSPKLSWKGVKGASYYNVQVFQQVGRKRVAIAWPHATSYRIPASKLKKGKTYVWYVWPGYGKLKAAKYGKLIGKSTFVYR
jgi:hypothetical protein